MTTVLAIDPGKEGGLVAVDQSGVRILAVRTPLAFGTFDARTAAELIAGLPRPIVGCIEKPAAHGRFKGAKGRPDSGYLAVKANVAAWKRCATFELEEVHARTWQASILGHVVDSKAQAIAWCQRFAPDVELMPGRCTTPQDGIADARCMAEWMRRRVPLIRAQGRVIG